MQFNREQYLDLMTFGHAPRPMFVELFGPLIGLESEWRKQGASEEEIGLTAFDFDYVSRTFAPCHAGLTGGGPPTVIENTPEYRIERDSLGRTMKLPKNTATIPLPLDFPVRTMDDWLKLKPRFAYHDGRIGWSAIEDAARQQAEGVLICAGIPGAWDTLRELMGEEAAALAYYDQPELVADVMATLTDTAVRVFEQVTEELTIDHLSVHEDLAGRSGPLVGPTQVREHFRPYFSAVWDVLSSRGCRVFCMDTDGNINAIIDDLLDCGLNCIYPMEPAAGMDVVALRERYSERLGMKGGIDKFVLMRDRSAIDAELEYKLQPPMRTGMVFGLDHRIPNGTPLANYRYYVDLAREILGLPPRDSGRTGWQRMAF